MRLELINDMILDLYGPKPTTKTFPLPDSEEILVDDPIKEYITGVITPVNCKEAEILLEKEHDFDEISEYSEEDSLDEYKQSVSTDLTTNMEINSFGTGLDPKKRPQSFGLSFVSNSNNPEIDLCITWARYVKTDNGWARKPDIYRNRWISKKDIEIFPIYDKNDGKINLHLRKVKRDGKYIITVHIVNNLNSSENCYGEELTESSIFQPSIRLNLKNSEFSNINFGKFMESDEDKTLNYLYRDKKVLSRGHMCSTVWKEIDPVLINNQGYIPQEVLWTDGIHFKKTGVLNEKSYSEFIRPDVRTEFTPIFSIPAPLFDWPEEYKNLKPELSAKKLSEMWEIDEINSYLNPLIESYEKWIFKNESEYKENEFISKLIENQKKCLERIKKGLELLKSDENARLSFCFANKVINMPYEWNQGREFNWRPFQLAFFLTNLESVYNENSEYRDVVDLMWVPTGGGKTEAYLALMAFLMAARRRKAILTNDPSAGAGTTILTRYTLRLLTIQQFRRTLKMVTVAEYLRLLKTEQGFGWKPKKCTNNNFWIYGSPKFSIGMWVGGAVTPNKVYDAITYLETNKKNIGDPAQITRCPICDSILSIPENGIPGNFKLFLTYINPKNQTLVEKVVTDLKKTENIQDCSYHVDNENLVLSLELFSEKNLKSDDLENIRKTTSSLSLKCANISKPGYFITKGAKNKANFEIYCPNSKCKLNENVNFFESIPHKINDAVESKDGYFISPPTENTFKGKRIPIPAYTVDDQIYHRCPTVIVCTVDKFAQLAFQPRSASIFGNVSYYNRYYGYYRKNLPSNYAANAYHAENNTKVKPFKPPELIIQDELHLIEGPLGSMYGLYENAIESLIRNMGGKPKYIVSTATIKNAEHQIEQLYSRDHFQFPPYGMDIEDSFFVRSINKESSWDEEKAGRVYMGIYAPSMGPLTPNVRIVSRLISSINSREDFEKYVNFKTIVWYFNAIRELGGGRALYREDIIEKLKDRFGILKWNRENIVELSSRSSSTEIPAMLTDLENQGNSENPSKNKDLMFTTSMFGTGVDISHLSTMLINGQPKTTSQYIQATGRVGRSVGGFSLIFLRAGRPRDLSHYELFPAYHQRIYLDVEPSSVSPYSGGCMSRALGPVMVSYLRNKIGARVEWDENNGKVILNDFDKEDLEDFIQMLKDKPKMSPKWDYLEKYIRSQWDLWNDCAKKIGSGELAFSEYALHKTPEKNVVLGSNSHEYIQELKKIFKNAPFSLREVEETTGFRV